MYKSVDPCEDFYKFACGRWMKKHPLKGNEMQKLVSDVKNNNYVLNFLNLLKKPLPDNSPRFLKMLKVQFDTCLDSGTNVNFGSNYLRHAINELGGWPIIVGEKWNGSEFDYIDTLIKISKMGLGETYLFQVKIEPYILNRTEYAIIIDKPTFVLKNTSFYQKPNENEVKKYIEKIKSDALRLGLKISNKDEQLKNIFKFETTLIEISKEQPEEVTKVLKSLNYKETQINWMKYIKSLANVDVPADQKIVFRDKSYITNFELLIFYSTNNETLANYLLWRVVNDNISFFNVGTDCLSFIQENLAIASSSMYVRAYFNDVMKQSASVIASYIRSTIIKNMNNVKWMTPKVRNFATTKLNKTAVHFPFVSELLNDTLIDNYYENLSFSRDSLLLNIVNIRKWRIHLNYKKLGTEHDMKDWDFHVNSKDIPLETFKNSVVNGVRMLQDPSYNEKLPKYMNFGGSGNSIARAAILGILDYAQNATKDGSFDGWWDNNTEKMYNTLSKCLAVQFSKSRFPGTKIKINYKDNKNINIADHLGFEAAYNAYLSWEKDNAVELTLPGLKYTTRQLFWINLANNFCCNYDDSYDYSLKNTDIPCIFRINGALSNLQEFSTEFHCKIGSPMNPVKKCNLH